MRLFKQIFQTLCYIKGHSITILIKRLEVLKSDTKNLTLTPEIDQLLENFCAWQQKQSQVYQHWDHALLLTGLDLKSKKSSKIVGLAPVSGMCLNESSCTVSEGSHFESVFVIAHELGHSLGMKHDGRTDFNDCDPGAYLMSPTLGSGKNSWSSCSKKYLDEFLRSKQSKCLEMTDTNHLEINIGNYLKSRHLSY